MTRLWTLLGATVIASACSDLFVTPYRYGGVEVAAETRAGAPIPGLSTVLYTGTRHLGYAVTDDRGVARFDFVPEGPLGVRVDPDGPFRPLGPDVPYFTEFRLAEGEERQFRFTFLGPGAVRVSAVREDGGPAAGHPVQLYDVAGTVEEQVVTGSGPLIFSEVPAGDYGVRALGVPSCPLPPAGFVYSDGHLVLGEDTLDVTLVVGPC